MMSIERAASFPAGAFTLAVAQYGMAAERAVNVTRALGMLEKAAAQGADLLLLPELFEYPYFPITRGNDDYFKQATPLAEHPYLAKFQACARKYRLAVTFSFFERANGHYYNALALIDKRGNVSAPYRKAHIPTGTGYEEDYYFSPGIQPLPVLPLALTTDAAPAAEAVVNVALGICWDQWFSESARAAALDGADILLYPSAIGSEPAPPRGAPSGDHAEAFSSQFHWQQVMCGHAAANLLVVAAANRIGTERAAAGSAASTVTLHFYGASFIASQEGRLLKTLGRTDAGMIIHRFTLARLRAFKDSWGLLRARRPELYRALVPAAPR